MTEELVALTEELRATRAMLMRILDRLDLADKRARRHRFGTAVLALVVAAVAVLGGWFYVDDQADDLRACSQANEARDDIRGAIVRTVEIVVAGTDDPAQLEPLIRTIEVELEETFPDRDC